MFTSPIKGNGRLCFRRRRYIDRYIGIYVCEQLPGTNSSPIVTITWSVIPLATGRGNKILEGQGQLKGQGRCWRYVLY